MAKSAFAVAVAIVGVAVSVGAASYAQDTETDRFPDIEEIQAVTMAFDGTSSVQRDLSERFDLRYGMSIEMWLAPAWDDFLMDDPCVVTLMDRGAEALSISIDKNGTYVGLFNGTDYAGYPMEFSKGGLNHLTVVAFGEYWEVFVNGEVSGLISFPTPTKVIDRIDVGGCGTEGPSYLGWISNLRLWNAPLSLNDIEAYLPVTDNLAEEDHPYFPLLGAWMRPDESGNVGIVTKFDTTQGDN